MSSTKETNRIVYLEPNNLPGDLAAVSTSGVKPDNITWAQEDLNITVDLQVVVPSRLYRPSNTESDLNFVNDISKYKSILSGVELKKGNPYLTDDYTTISYQEIKNNNAGSTEFLGINSIQISFDSHMYPRVTMNFTDVRGSALMMPQEQLVYDINSKSGIEESKVCKSFFQSFFKFPYPRFLLSVKGIYGTCVTFVLSVENFNATFNSESGNFDVVVTFIGLMYGLYTDIPMNYLLIAPYLGVGDGGYTQYWSRQTSVNGDFYYIENGGRGEKILTFFEFVEKYKGIFADDELNLLSQGENVSAIARARSESAILDKLLSLYENVEKNIVTPNYVTKRTRNLRFIFSPDESGFSLAENFIKEFNDCLDSLGENKEYGFKPGQYGRVIDEIREGKQNITGISTSFEEKRESENTSYDWDCTKETHEKKFDDDFREIGESLANGFYGYVKDCKSYQYIDMTLKNEINERRNDIQKSIESMQNGAAEEISTVFKNRCSFTPTVENVMRMVFAHLDAFLHEFYSVLSSIKKRTLGEYGWDIKDTDILSSSDINVEIPPFAAFYKERNGRSEIIFPDEDAKLSTLEEVGFVRNIFSGLDNLLKRFDVENTEPIVDSVNVSQDFFPIAITDMAYSGMNPYNALVGGDDEINNLLYFAANRIFVGIRDSVDEDKSAKEIIQTEYENLRSSLFWDTVKKVYKNNNEKKIDEVKTDSICNTCKTSIHSLVVERYSSRRGRDSGNATGNLSVRVSKGGSCFYKFNGVKKLSTGDTEDTEDYSLLKLQGLQYFERNENSPILKFVRKINESSKDFIKAKTLTNVNILSAKPTQAIMLCLSANGNPIYYPHTKGNENPFISMYQAFNVDRSGIEEESLIKNAANETDENKIVLKYWVPSISGGDGSANLFYNENSVLYDDSEYSKQEKAVWFLYRLLSYESSLLTDKGAFPKTDFILTTQKAVYYYLGGIFYLRENGSKKYKKWLFDSFKRFDTSLKKDTAIKAFEKWVVDSDNGFEAILKESGKEKGKEPLYSLMYNIPALDPGTELQRLLINLVRETCYIAHYDSDISIEEMNKQYTVLGAVKKAYLDDFLNKIKEELSKTDNSEKPSDIANANTQNVSTEKKRYLSSYCSLKNLYDRWLCSYTENSFKLKSPDETIAAKRRKLNGSALNTDSDYSEFDNFLFVDSFYNDISNRFFINPESFFNIVYDEIKGITNYNALEFIGKICESNKLLFSCLPVYNNLYNKKTFMEIFTPHSLYSGYNTTQKRIGNTYLIMYTYEPSHILNMVQDKTNDVSTRNDSFDIADTFGEITDDAAKLFDYSNNESNYNICAFGVTPGRQNQSYFTKVSIGMDAPRVTDFSIKNKFMLADSVKGGRAEGIGAGQDLFSIYSNRSYDCTVEMLGCANIMPMMYFQLNNVPMFKGVYMITKVEHNIQNNTMTTKFVGTRMSKRYVPFNTNIFNVEQIMNIMNNVQVDKNADVYLGDGSISYANGVYRRVGQEYAVVNNPTSPVNGTFYASDAVEQMNQYLHFVKDGISKYGIPIERTGGYSNCARAVMYYLMAGFEGYTDVKDGDTEGAVKLDTKRHNKGYSGYNGYAAKAKLADLGFECIAIGAEAINAVGKKENGGWKQGDVCVTLSPKNMYGHICMYSGDGWVSDFKQGGWWVYGTIRTEAYKGTGCLLYRYAGTIENRLKSKIENK